MEVSIEVSQKTKNKTTIWFYYTHSWVYTQRNQSQHIIEIPAPHVYHGTYY
jgi:hypothetical protein